MIVLLFTALHMNPPADLLDQWGDLTNVQQQTAIDTIDEYGEDLWSIGDPRDFDCTSANDQEYIADELGIPGGVGTWAGIGIFVHCAGMTLDMHDACYADCYVLCNPGTSDEVQRCVDQCQSSCDDSIVGDFDDCAGWFIAMD